jgi:DNA helicase II / ATP-dependent DNA helicase PcrA
MKQIEICAKRQQILDCRSHILILGGPGSGKTTISLYKGQKAAEAGLLGRHQKVLFLSFSKAAVRQVTSKLTDFFKSSGKELVTVQTYHSFCWDVLKAYSYLLLPGKQISLLPPHEETVLKNKYLGEKWEAAQTELFHSNARLCFDLFAPLTAELFARSRSICNMYSSKYPIIVVDEFQDSDAFQWAIVKHLSERSQVICLADPEQQIYSWRSQTVSADRINDVKEHLKPLIVDFLDENNRSPKSTIAAFANTMLKDKKKFAISDEIKLIQYPSWQTSIYLKMAVLNAFAFLKKTEANKPYTVAIFARTNQYIRTVCDYLDSEDRLGSRKLKPISFSVFIDEHAVIQAGRCISSFMDASSKPENGLAEGLAIVSDFFNCNRGTTNSDKASKIDEWRSGVLVGKIPKTNCVSEIFRIKNLLSKPDNGLIGDPMTDWIFIRQLLASSKSAELKRIADYSKQLRLLRRGSQIADAFSVLWRTHGSYLGSIDAFDRAVADEHLSQNYFEPSGCLVMNMHKSKGKEFDAVIIIENPYNASFVSKDNAPFTESRKLLRVAITRARYFVQILTDKTTPSPLLAAFYK